MSEFTLPPIADLPQPPEDLIQDIDANIDPDVLAAIQERDDQVRDIIDWSKSLIQKLQASYVPQTDRIENMIMSGALENRPEPRATRRVFFDQNTQVAYIDSYDDGGQAAWIPLNSVTSISPSGGGGGGDAETYNSVQATTKNEFFKSEEDLLWDIEVYDYGDMMDGDNSTEFTIPVTGDYHFEFYIQFDGIEDGDWAWVSTYINGEKVGERTASYQYDGEDPVIEFDGTGTYDAGDVIVFVVGSDRDPIPGYGDDNIYILNAKVTITQVKVTEKATSKSVISKPLAAAAVSGGIHASLSGLLNDDHTQYLLASAATDRATFAANWTDLTDGGDTSLHIHDSRYYTESEIDSLIGAIDHGSLGGLLDDDHTQYVLRSEWGQNGFEDADDVSLAWDDGTRTLTVSPAVTSFSYFLGGVKYTETGNLTETITDTEGLWVFYIDSEGSITSALNPSAEDVANVIVNYTIIAYVYWDATNNDGRLLPEWHGASMSPQTHRYLHFTQHAQWVSGMAIQDIDTSGNGNSDSDAQFGIGAGTFDDEDVFWQLSAIAAGDPIEIWYREGASAWRWTETTISGESFPVIPFSGGSGRLAWNDFTGGAWQQTEVDNNDFVLCHIFATNITADDGTGPKYIAIQGQNEYNTIGLARDGALVEINAIAYGTLPLEEIVPIATVIYQTSGGDTNKVKARTQPTDSGADWVDWLTNEPGEGSASDHGSLAGLGDDDHTQYLLADGTRALTGAWSAGQTITAPGFVASVGNDFEVNSGAFKDSVIGDMLKYESSGTPRTIVGNTGAWVELASNGLVNIASADILLAIDKYLQAFSGSTKNLIGLSASGVEVGNSGETLLLKSTDYATFDSCEPLLQNAKYLKGINTSAAIKDLLGINGSDEVILGDTDQSMQIKAYTDSGMYVYGDSFHRFEREMQTGGTITSTQASMVLAMASDGSTSIGNDGGPDFLFECENASGTAKYLARIAALWENSAAGSEAGYLKFMIRGGSSVAFATTFGMKIIPGVHVVQACDSSAPADADMENESYCFYYDGSAGTKYLKVKHKDSGGTVRTGTVATVA